MMNYYSLAALEKNIFPMISLLIALMTLSKRKYSTFFFMSIFSLLISNIPLIYKFSLILPISYLLFFLLSYEDFLEVKKNVRFDSYGFLSIFLGSVPHTLIIAFAGIMGYIFFENVNLLSFFLIFLTSFIEELFFRIKIFKEYNKFNIILSSLSFSLFHTPLIPFTYNDFLYIFLMYLFFGLSLQYIYIYYGFTNSFLLHFTYNIIALNYVVSLDAYSISILIFSQLFLILLITKILDIKIIRNNLVPKLHAYKRLFL